MDEPELEVLTYRAFRDRQIQLEWERRRLAYEHFGSLHAAASRRTRSGLWWVRSAGEWVSDQLWRTVQD
jgi:hypothetical protein